MPADVLEKGAVIGILAAHTGGPQFSSRVAMLETAKRALTKLHFSRRLREAELARARTEPEAVGYQVGDLVYFYRNSMRATRKDRKEKNAKILLLNRWHGPAMVCGREGNTAVYIGWRGGITKCPPENVRKASPMEAIAAESWAEALQKVLDSCAEPSPTVEEEVVAEESARADALPAGLAFGPAPEVVRASPSASPSDMLYPLGTRTTSDSVRPAGAVFPKRLL